MGEFSFADNNWIYLAGGIFISLAMIAVWLRQLTRWYRPVKLDLSYLPASANGNHLGLQFQVASNGAGGPGNPAIGRVGELLTGVLFVVDGWTQLPSRPDTRQRIDGIFVKQYGKGKWKVAFVETRSTINSLPNALQVGVIESLGPKRLVEELSHFSDPNVAHMPNDLVKALTGAIERRSKHVRRYLYNHSFSDGRTRIFNVRPNGKVVDKGSRMLEDESHKNLCQSLAIGLERILSVSDGLLPGGAKMRT